MGYYVSNLIGIRTGGVFSEPADVDDMRQRITAIVLSMRGTDHDPPFAGEPGDPSHCMSRELVASKGGYVVIAGVFNYWTYEKSSVFAQRLSQEFGTDVMHMCWNEETDQVRCQLWVAGRSVLDAVEDPVGKILRRVS
jgi:hypothetical protein